MMSAPRNADEKSATSKPWTKLAIPQKRSAFTTKEKSPNVSTVMGKKSTRSTGRMTAFANPQKNATISAMVNAEMDIPGRICGRARKTRATNIHFARSFMREKWLEIGGHDIFRLSQHKGLYVFDRRVENTPDRLVRVERIMGRDDGARMFDKVMIAQGGFET